MVHLLLLQLIACHPLLCNAAAAMNGPAWLEGQHLSSATPCNHPAEQVGATDAHPHVPESAVRRSFGPSPTKPVRIASSTKGHVADQCCVWPRIQRVDTEIGTKAVADDCAQLERLQDTNSSKQQMGTLCTYSLMPGALQLALVF